MKGAPGFTLIELLVALVIVGLIATLASGSIRLGLRSNERLLSGAEAADAERAMQGQVRHWLESAEPLVVEQPDRASLPLAGGPEAIEFSTEMPGRDGIGGLWRVRMLVEDDALLIERQRLVEDGLGREIDRSILVPGTAGVRFAYSDGGDWQDAWTEASRLPRKIRLTLTSSMPGVPPAEMIVAPAVTRGPR